MDRFYILLYLLLLAVMTVATFSFEFIYGSILFSVIWIAFFLVTLVLLFKNKMWKRLSLFALHISFLLMMTGGFLTYTIGVKGSLHLRVGEQSSFYAAQPDNLLTEIPFSVSLESFTIKEGNNDDGMPSDYISRVVITDSDGEVTSHAISMNHTLRYRDYLFYQASYDEDLQGSLLLVNHDPLGILISFSGFYLFILSMILLLLDKRNEFLKLINLHFLKKAGAFILLIGLCSFYDSSLNAANIFYAIPFVKIAFMFNLSAGLIATSLLLYRGREGKIFDIALNVSLLFMSVGYALRWYVSGHVPLANGCEAMQFMAICIMFVSLLLRRKIHFIQPFGLLASGFVLLVSFIGQPDPQIDPLVPVLASPWLSAHVSVIMMSYALFFFMMINGVIGLCVPKYDIRLMGLSRLLLYPAVALLGTGIVLGAVWANVSWGGYWSWDPKETWALITFMIYGAAFHKGLCGKFNNPRFFHIYMLIAFLAVLMTYFGVNYLLGGLHSYA